MPIFKLLVPTVIAVTIMVVGAGLYVSGSPMQARRERFDTQRVNDLQQISYAIDTFWLTKQRLPNTLEELRENMYPSSYSSYYFGSAKDPRTGTAYEYRTKDGTGTYELCSAFEADDRTTKNPSPYNAYSPNAPLWHHQVGRTCFSLQVRTLDQKLPKT